MIKKEVFIGFIVGVIANGMGLLLAALLLGRGDDVTTVIKAAAAEDFLGKLISIGAILNLAAFFIFIKKRQDYRARGVILATVCIAIFTFIFKFI
ncbi:hypothetical protein [Formosa algae]|uniref:Uncharacterized protein n=1 Tax=Formosa algae TaxID=225843 RepID=A0A9X0YHV7_9FLAO|nr:hypothetical protein [Formosa algae]MBP1839190.1 hypothetical protein [Formosa algae]MDQ0333967.1 hypothetical protein [Formosa algae]OEI79699.1 hypothetical protein AST99_13190 [Formosa algae]PNW27592.1 hypothetical protein BKP44_12350 [Formosa algae]